MNPQQISIFSSTSVISLRYCVCMYTSPSASDGPLKVTQVTLKPLICAFFILIRSLSRLCQPRGMQCALQGGQFLFLVCGLLLCLSALFSILTAGLVPFLFCLCLCLSEGALMRSSLALGLCFISFSRMLRLQVFVAALQIGVRYSFIPGLCSPPLCSLSLLLPFFNLFPEMCSPNLRSQSDSPSLVAIALT